MAAFVSSYNAVGNLDVYSLLYSFFIPGQWLDLFQIIYFVTIQVLTFSKIPYTKKFFLTELRPIFSCGEKSIHF